MSGLYHGKKTGSSAPNSYHWMSKSDHSNASDSVWTHRKVYKHFPQRRTYFTSPCTHRSFNTRLTALHSSYTWVYPILWESDHRTGNFILQVHLNKQLLNCHSNVCVLCFRVWFGYTHISTPTASVSYDQPTSLFQVYREQVWSLGLSLIRACSGRLLPHVQNLQIKYKLISITFSKGLNKS